MPHFPSVEHRDVLVKNFMEYRRVLEEGCVRSYCEAATFKGFTGEVPEDVRGLWEELGGTWKGFIDDFERVEARQKYLQERVWTP